MIVWDAGTGEPIQTLYGHGNIFKNLLLSKDGKRLLMDNHNTKLIVWNVESGCIDLVISSADTAKYFPDDEKILAYGAKSHSMQTLSDNIGGIKWCYNYITHEQAIMLSGEKVFICDLPNNNAIIADLHTGEMVRSFPVLNHNYALSPDKKMLLALAEIKDKSLMNSISKTLSHVGDLIPFINKSTMRYSGYIIKLWDIGTGSELYTFDNIRGTMCFSPDSSMVAGNLNGKIHLWDVKTFKKIKTIGADLEDQWNLKITPDGKFLLVMNIVGLLEMWNIKTGKLENSFSHNNGIDDYYLSPKGTKIVMHHGNYLGNAFLAADTLTIRDAASGNYIIELARRHNNVKFINEDIVLYDGCGKQKPYLLDLRTNKKLCSFLEINSECCYIDYCPDSAMTFITNFNGCMFMYDISEYLESNKSPGATGKTRDTQISK